MSTPEKNAPVNRYSDADLEMFRELIEGKLAVAKEQVDQLQSQSLELSESLQANGYDVDENHAYSEVEFLNSMVVRQKKHIVDLENALRRIKNKNYGICMISGLLIDKRRLMAVPTTTKSLLAKNEQANQALQKTKPAPMKKPVAGAAPKQFTKIIKKTPEVKPIPVDPLLENDDDDFEDDLDDLDLDEITSSFEDLEDDED